MKVILVLLASCVTANATTTDGCIASVYNTHEKWGTRTASGIPLRDSALSMAHRTHVLRGWMKVTNKKTGKSVVLKVIDRGPYRANRCADLSVAAAKELGIDGLGPVLLEPWSK